MVAKLIQGLRTHVPLKSPDLISVADNYIVCSLSTYLPSVAVEQIYLFCE